MTIIPNKFIQEFSKYFQYTKYFFLHKIWISSKLAILDLYIINGCYSQFQGMIKLITLGT